MSLSTLHLHRLESKCLRKVNHYTLNLELSEILRIFSTGNSIYHDISDMNHSFCLLR